MQEFAGELAIREFQGRVMLLYGSSAVRGARVRRMSLRDHLPAQELRGEVRTVLPADRINVCRCRS